jgi:glyoxylase-like metal-dependent hydrolase (beta-lactamase superfamily II)
MNSKILLTSLALIPIILSIGIIPNISLVDALQEEDSETECREGQILVFRTIANNYACVSESTAKKWVQYGIAEIVGESVEEEMMEEEMMEEEMMEETMEESTISESILMYTQEAPTIDPEKGYFVTEISDGLYWLSDGLYQIMFLTTGEGVIVVDAPPSMGENILSAINEVTDEPITHVIYSHIHQDHIGAAYIYPEDVTIISHKDTATHLQMKNDPNRPIPTETFDDTYTLSIGEQTLELSYTGAFHSKGDVMIFAPKQNVLMVVDQFHPAGAPFKGFAVTKDMNYYIAAHDTMLEINPALIISGHTEILATTDHVETNKEFTMNVLENTNTAFQTVDFNEIAQENPSLGMIEVFGVYLDTLTTTCADLTMEQWDGKLHNLGVFMEDNCSAMVMHVMID